MMFDNRQSDVEDTDVKCCSLCTRYQRASNCVQKYNQILTSLPKVIWEEGRVAAAVPGAGWHKGLRIRNVCIVLVKDMCANVRYFSVRKQE